MVQQSQAKHSGQSTDSTKCRDCGAALGAGVPGPNDAGRRCESCHLDRCRDRVCALDRDYASFAEALVAALDLREHETGLHSKRVACHTLVLARRFLDRPEDLQNVYWGALLHDVGKIGVPDSVLLKAGPLDAEEWALMKVHPEAGRRILAPVAAFDAAAQIVLCHEERHDGSGYPAGLRGDAIPLGARLFAVIDTLDAMTSDRPYRRALDFDTAKAEILRLSDTQFDPLAVEAFLLEELVLRDMVALKCNTATARKAPAARIPD